MFIVVAVIGYSVLPVWTNLLLDAGMLPFDIGVWRFVIAAPVFWIASFILDRRRAGGAVAILPMPRLRLMLLGSLYSASALAAFFGLDLIPAGTYSVIFYTFPAMVALMGLLLGERLALIGWAAIGMTLVGVMLTAPDFSEGLAGANFTGVVLALINAVTVAVYFIVSGRLLADRVTGLASMARAVAWTMTGTLFFIAIAALFVGVNLPTQPLQVVYLFGLGLISTVMSVFCLNMGIQMTGPTRAAVFGTFEPLLTAIMAFIFLGQAMLPIQWVGGIVVVASMIVLQTRGSQPTGAAESVT